MNWSEAIADPSLRDLPYKIELDHWGNLLLSPRTNLHGRFKGRLGVCLGDLAGGEALINCATATADGVRVADVAWASNAFLHRHGYETPYSEAPEICVEVRSPSNREEEMQLKIRLYLEAGAKEVWIVREDGIVRYFDGNGERKASRYGLDPVPLLNH